jgi:uncharacterized repeat protein (TIGR01451 family)
LRHGAAVIGRENTRRLVVRVGASIARRRSSCVALAALALSASAWAADPQIASFTDNPDPVPAGGLVTYTARITNSAIDDALNVSLAVPVPAGTTFVSTTAPCALAAGTVTCALGTVAANDSDVRLLDFVFRANGPGPTAVTATATLTASNDTNPANNTQSQTTTVVQGGDLSLVKSGAPDPVVGGSNVTYTLTASNAGPNDSGAIVVTDNLPPSVAYVSGSGGGWSCTAAGSVVTCNHPGPHVAGAAIPALTIVGTVNAAGGTVTNSATVAPAVGGTADPDSTNNTATVNTSVLPGADVQIAQKTVTSAVPAVAGQPVTFQIQPRNGGPASAANAVVSDVLPAGWAFVSAGGPNWPCSAAGQTVTCIRASFPAGRSTTSPSSRRRRTTPPSARREPATRTRRRSRAARPIRTAATTPARSASPCCPTAPTSGSASRRARTPSRRAAR